MAADTLKLKGAVSNLLDQVFDAVSGGVDAASPIVQNRALRQENATLQRQLALLREADDNEFDQLHDYLGHLHVRLAKLEQDYAALESRQAETHASPEQHDQLALVPAPVVEEAGAAHEVAALVHRVAPSLERLPGIEAQLGELAELKAEMQAAVRALQQARAQPQQPPADAGQLHQMSKELRALRKAVQQQQREAGGQDVTPAPGLPGEAAAAAARAQVLTEGVHATAAAGEASAKRRRTDAEEEPPRSKRPADDRARPIRDSTAEAVPSRTATPRTYEETRRERGASLGHTSPYLVGNEVDIGDLPQQAAIAGSSALDRPLQPALAQRKLKEERNVCAGQRNNKWLSYMWRCPLCCLGFKGKFALAKHFRSRQHITFAKDAYEYLARRSSATNVRFPEGEYIANPFPCCNRTSGEELRSHAVMWSCQVCDMRLNGLQYLVHQFSHRHQNMLKGMLDAPARTPPLPDAAPQTV